MALVLREAVGQGPRELLVKEDEEQSGLYVPFGEAIGVTFVVPFKQPVGLQFCTGPSRVG
jgi:hypothetical protein